MRIPRLRFLIFSFIILYGIFTGFMDGTKKRSETVHADSSEIILSKLGIELDENSFIHPQQEGSLSGVEIIKIHKGGVIDTQTLIQEKFIINQIDDLEVFSVDQVIDILKDKRGRICLKGNYNDLMAFYDDIPGDFEYEVFINQ